jgi:ribosomal protein S27E
MDQDHCPGSAFIRTPTLTIKICPECGEEVEVFSNDFSVECEKCGFTVYNDQQSCIDWCKYARECLGDEVYEKLKGRSEENGGETSVEAE